MTVMRRLSYHMLVLLAMEMSDAVFDLIAVVAAVTKAGAVNVVPSSLAAVLETFVSKSLMQNYYNHWKLWLLNRY